jgi:hypothetical protein
MSKTLLSAEKNVEKVTFRGKNVEKVTFRGKNVEKIDLFQHPKRKSLLEDYEVPLYFRDDLFKYCSESRSQCYKTPFWAENFFGQLFIPHRNMPLINNSRPGWC